MKQFLKDSDLALFAEQLSMILHSGISLLEGISILRDDLPEGPVHDRMSQIYDFLEETGELAPALQQTECWPEYFIKMTELGERSGTLEDVMQTLSAHYDRRGALFRSIRDALVYPLVLLGMLSAVLFVLMTQVMPVFYQVFQQLGIAVTGVTAAVFRISRTAQAIAVVLLILLLAALICCIPALKSEKGRQRHLTWLRRLPLVKQILFLLSCSRFSNALSIAMHSGLDMSESFELASSLVEDDDFQLRIRAASSLLDQGTEFGEALSQTGIFTGMNARMFSLGFRTGSAETVLEKISVSCQEEADLRIQSAVGALEPALTVILSLLTGLLLISVMLPLLSVMTGIG